MLYIFKLITTIFVLNEPLNKSNERNHKKQLVMFSLNYRSTSAHELVPG